MTMKLYYAPGTCSLAPMILAEWLDLPLAIERVNHREPSPAYLAKNPLGAVPALELESGRVFTQVDAILQYFCELKPGSGLDAGEDLLDQFEAHRWVAFLTGDYHPPFGAWFNPRRYTTDHSESALAAVKDALSLRLARLNGLLDKQVGDSGHIVLGRRTFLDAYAYAMVRWTRFLEGGFQPYPNLSRFMDEMSSDSGVVRALEREKG